MDRNIRIAKELVRIAKSLVGLDERFDKEYSDEMAKKLFDDMKSKLLSMNGITKVEAIDEKSNLGWIKEVFFKVNTSDKEFYILVTINHSLGTIVYISSYKTKSENDEIVSFGDGCGVDEAVDTIVKCANYTIKALSETKKDDENDENETGTALSDSDKKRTYEVSWDGRGMEISCDFWLKGADLKAQQNFQDEIYNAFHNSVKSMYRSKNLYGVNMVFIRMYGKTKLEESDIAEEPLKSIVRYLNSRGYERVD